MSRRVEEATERDYVRSRKHIWLGKHSNIGVSQMTVSIKEICDNECDVCQERSQPATAAIIKLCKNRVDVMDNGAGISTDVKNPKNVSHLRTHLGLAVGKLFTSSNFEGTDDSVGSNGLGSTLANFTSANFAALNFNPDGRQKTVRGYIYRNGYLQGSNEDVNIMANTIEAYRAPRSKSYTPQSIYDELLVDLDYLDENNLPHTTETSKKRNKTIEFVAEENGERVTKEVDFTFGDRVLDPFSREEAFEKFPTMEYDYGYFVTATYDRLEDEKNPNITFDEYANVDWLVDYIRLRVGEIDNPKFENIRVDVYTDDTFSELSYSRTFSKDKTSDTYVSSWEERCLEFGATIVKSGDWKIAFAKDNVKDENGNVMHIKSMVMGAPVENTYLVKNSINIEDYSVGFNVPYSLYFRSKELPPYKDQSKVVISRPYSIIGQAFEKSKDIYNYYYEVAKARYNAYIIRNADVGMFYPSLGPIEKSTLYIVEGVSAAGNIRMMRNPDTDAILALRGKFSNCWGKPLTKSLNSEVVKQILLAVKDSEFEEGSGEMKTYEKIIMVTDADPDGAHITMLAVGLIAQHAPEIILNNKLFFIKTPYYIFKKRGAEDLWSDDPLDCPKGYHTTTCKGLGSLTEQQAKRFILDEDARELWCIEWDRKSSKALDFSMGEGGKGWIVG